MRPAFGAQMSLCLGVAVGDQAEDWGSHLVSKHVDVGSRIVKVRMVEDVVCLHPQLGVDALGELHGLRNERSKSTRPGTVEMVSADVSRPVEQRRPTSVRTPREGVRIGKPMLRSRRILGVLNPGPLPAKYGFCPGTRWAKPLNPVRSMSVVLKTSNAIVCSYCNVVIPADSMPSKCPYDSSRR